MKIFKNFFSKQPSSEKPTNKKLSISETQKLTTEIEKLKRIENKYKNKLDELVEEKILLQIKINELNKINQECINCSNLNEEIKKIGKSKGMLSQKLENLKTAIKIEKEIEDNKERDYNHKDIVPVTAEESFPELEKYFVANGKYYLLDKEANLYILKKCNNFKEYMEGIIKEKEISGEDVNMQDVIMQYFKREK